MSAYDREKVSITKIINIHPLAILCLHIVLLMLQKISLVATEVEADYGKVL